MKRALILLSAIAVAGAVVPAQSTSAAQRSPALAGGRSGALHVTKECSEYDGTVGSFCTIQSSNVRAIKPGMKVVYLAALPPNGVLDSDVVVSSGHGGAALGHVVLDLSTSQGRVRLTVGTGRFARFHARAHVSFEPATGLWHWDGTYTLRAKR
jgi:hypothetical protein